jgi:hypothetical protein
MAYLQGLPINDTPEIFGLHENANITFAQNETFSLLSGLLALQPKTSSGGGATREEVRHYPPISTICFNFTFMIYAFWFVTISFVKNCGDFFKIIMVDID